MKVHYLNNKIPWFGKYSGYECLTSYLPENLDSAIYSSKSSFINKAIGKYFQLRNEWHSVRTEDVHIGIKFMQQVKNSTISHILYLENHIHLLENVRIKNKYLTGTIHLPISQWKEKNLSLLSKLEHVIILYKEEIEEFGKYIPKSKIHFIQHGIDINFFKPGNSNKVNKNKVLFVGHYLRDFDMLMKVYQIIVKEISDEIEFHFIIPESFRKSIPVFTELSQKSNVFFHQKLTDEELLEQYQTSYVLLMPMQDSGANTAIVQGISTGLPVITTDVGGIRSYGGGEIFPVVPINNHIEMVQLFKKYYFDNNYRNVISEKQRSYAVENLDWNLIAKQHSSLYNSLRS